METVVSTVGAVNRIALKKGISTGASVPSSAFYGSSLKKSNLNTSRGRISTGSLKVMDVDLDETKQTKADRWTGLGIDISDDQQDITRGKGLVDALFKAPTGDGTHVAVLISYEYISQGLREYSMDNTIEGLYIAPTFMDKLVVHIAKNFMNLPNIKVMYDKGLMAGYVWSYDKEMRWCSKVFREIGRFLKDAWS